MGQRVLLLGIVIACGASSVLLVGWARKPVLSLLYTGLSQEEAARIVEKVRDEGTQYELKDGGTTVYVPTDKVYSLRLAMASQGLPRGDQAGYRILDEERLGISPFSQRINYLRAVEGELVKTIQLLDGVASARVHIVRPEETLFAGKDREATATVVLRMRGAFRLTPSNIAAVVHLVAGSVEGLQPQKVVLVNAQGTLLSGQGVDEMAKAGTFLEYKARVEEYLSRKAEDMLAAALGPGRASVRVDAAVETLASDTRTETYDPEKKVVTKEETKTLSSSAPSNAAGATKEENSTSEYQVSKVTKTETDMPGKVKSVTVAAFVDLSAPPAPAAPAGGAAPAAPATKLTLKDAEDIIRSAMGLKLTDTIKVVDTPFYRAPAAADTGAEEQKQASREFYLEIARRASLGLLVLGALVALKIFRGSKKKGAGGAALPGGMSMGALEGQSSAGLLGGGEAELNPEMLRARISHALQENPEEVKRLFLSWAESDKGGA